MAIGYLELLWHFTAQFAPQGDIGRYSIKRIEAALDWHGRSGALVQALLDSGWIENLEIAPDGAQLLVVHDWHDHADDATRRRLERAGLRFLSEASPRVRQGSDRAVTGQRQGSDSGVTGQSLGSDRAATPEVPKVATEKNHEVAAKVTGFRRPRARAGLARALPEPEPPPQQQSITLSSTEQSPAPLLVVDGNSEIPPELRSWAESLGGPPDALTQLWRECRTIDPSCTGDEVAYACYAKLPHADAVRRVSNPIGLLTATVPRFFCDGGSKLIREFRKKQSRVG